jgi:hypothetical protein
MPIASLEVPQIPRAFNSDSGVYGWILDNAVRDAP